MKKIICVLLASLLLTGCATVAEPSSADIATAPTESIAHTESETAPMAESIPAETVTATDPVVPEHFELTDEAILLTEENSPDAIGGYVQCPLGYLVNFFEARNPEGYMIIGDVDPETMFKVVGVTYISDASCSPSTELESVPPVTREDFIRAPHYEAPEDPDNIHDFDYFDYVGAVMPIIRGANAFLLIQETEVSQVYCVPPRTAPVCGLLMPTCIRHDQGHLKCRIFLFDIHIECFISCMLVRYVAFLAPRTPSYTGGL